MSVAEQDGVAADQVDDFLLDALKTLQRKRRHYIRDINRLNNGTRSMIQRHLGWHWDSPEAERKKIRTKAERIMATIKKAYENNVEVVVPQDIRDDLLDDIVCRIEACAPLQTMRVNIEKPMEKLAKRLPVWPWCENVKGFGAKGLAVVVGEAGDLANYPNPAKLWMRMELGIIDGQRQRRVKNAEEALRHGYSGQRRAEMYAFFDDKLLMAQWRGDKKENGKVLLNDDGEPLIPAHAIGPYGEIYGRKKAEYLARDDKEWHKTRCDRAARRYMTKQVLKHLWKAWRRETLDKEQWTDAVVISAS